MQCKKYFSSSKGSTKIRNWWFGTIPFKLWRISLWFGIEIQSLKHSPFGGVSRLYIELSPFPVIVTTRIFALLSENPELNLHLSLLGRRTTQVAHVFVERIYVDVKPVPTLTYHRFNRSQHKESHHFTKIQSTGSPSEATWHKYLGSTDNATWLVNYTWYILGIAVVFNKDTAFQKVSG